ncbi:DNA mismatch endonuclease Vsr [Pontibacter sp. KCTC 32443]|uniref:very short patch repair endonuclease n=2 Tax=Pontibacter TaxID=323449 RepID=UPI00164E3E55|nr:DNA mismatch endonuclease Vsr [Pontibacter sp. KCTC 32443]MBC5774347.1 DNA mismatch endonuclease Vsr [Pontibacter sp. KCTC 32443]
MADVHSKATRSYNMSRIKGKDTKPEMVVRKFLHAKGLRYRLHDKKLPGKPDVVLPKYKTIVNIHGCFWHGHEGCRYYVIPKTRTEWWQHKINRNRELDQQNLSKLIQEGWKVLTIFECELKPKVRAGTLDRLLEQIRFENSGN